MAQLDLLSERIFTNLTPLDKQKLENQARSIGLNLTSFVRMILIKYLRENESQKDINK